MSIKNNFIYNLAYQILTMILPLITTPYIARVIGPTGVGIQAYTYSIVNYFVLFSMLGINNHGNRSIAMVRDDKERLSRTFISIYSIQAIMSLLMIIIYSIYIIFFIKEYKIIFIIQIIYIITSFLDINWFFFGMEEFRLTVIRNSIIKLASVCSIFIFVKNSNDLYIYSLILALSGLLSQVVLWIYIKKYIIFIRVKWSEIISNIKPILILFIPVIAISIYKTMDKIMLGSMSTVIEVGFFENSEKIINIPLGLITALGTVMLPKMSNLYAKGNTNESKKYIRLSMGFAMFMSIGSIFGLIGVGSVLIPVFLGNEFNRCINIVSLLAITLLFLSWANVIRTQYLIPKRRDSIYIISTILGATVNVIINMLLIKKYGAAGTAIGTIFAEAIVAIYQTMMVRNELEIKLFLRENIFYIIPGIIMCLLVRYIGKVMGISLFTGIVQIVIGGIVYCSISLIYMIIIKNEIIINMVRKVRR